MQTDRIPMPYLRKNGICIHTACRTPPSKKANPYRYKEALSAIRKFIPEKLILIIHILMNPYPANSLIHAGTYGTTVTTHVIPAPNAPPKSTLNRVAVQLRTFLMRNNSKVSIKKFSRKNASIYSLYYTTHLPYFSLVPL